MQRFEIAGAEGDVEIMCLICDTWWARLTGFTSLAELVQRADEHTEVCR